MRKMCRIFFFFSLYNLDFVAWLAPPNKLYKKIVNWTRTNPNICPLQTKCTLLRFYCLLCFLQKIIKLFSSFYIQILTFGFIDQAATLKQLTICLLWQTRNFCLNYLHEHSRKVSLNFYSNCELGALFSYSTFVMVSYNEHEKCTEMNIASN